VGLAGWPTEAGIAEDARATFDWVRQRLYDKRESRYCLPGGGRVHLYLYGQSLGTAVAIRLASELTRSGMAPDGLIIDAGFTNMSDASKVHVVAKPFTSLPVLNDMITSRVGKLWPSTDRIRDIECPILIFHGMRDLILPFHFGRTLYQTAQASNSRDVRYFELPGAGHNDIYTFSEWLVEMSAFMQTVESSSCLS
jgi:abhydrolase domain-containing protein 12